MKQIYLKKRKVDMLKSTFPVPFVAFMTLMVYRYFIHIHTTLFCVAFTINISNIDKFICVRERVYLPKAFPHALAGRNTRSIFNRSEFTVFHRLHHFPFQVLYPPLS